MTHREGIEGLDLDDSPAGRTDSALTTCQHYLTLYPGDPGMRDNLACLE